MLKALENIATYKILENKSFIMYRYVKNVKRRKPWKVYIHQKSQRVKASKGISASKPWKIKALKGTCTWKSHKVKAS